VQPDVVKSQRLKAFIAENDTALLKSLRLYVLRAGMAAHADAEQVARDLLSEVVVEALDHADRFDTARHPMSWLLGIGANLIKRRQSDRARRERREPLIRDMYDGIEGQMSDDELFDRLTAMSEDSANTPLEQRESIEQLLAELSLEDRQVIQLAILHDLDGASLAKQLGVKPGTARMRLHRALRRLRSAHNADEPVGNDSDD